MHHAKLQRQARSTNTFEQAAIDFIEQHAKRNTRTWREKARYLGLRADKQDQLQLIPKGLADRWRIRVVADIDSDDLHALIEEVRDQGIPGLTRRTKGPNEPRALAMFAALSKLFNWLVGKRRLSQSPCASVHRPATQKSRDRVLSTAEIVAFWRAAEAERKEFAAVLKLLLLTGQRLGEVRAMRRSELSEDGGIWTIPAARVKNKRQHIVPLPPLARRIIREAGGDGEIVFSTNGSAPVTIGSKIKKRLDGRMKAAAAWREHDLRRTCATGMAEIGVSPHIIEAVLNHLSGHRAGVAGTYNRAAYAAEKKSALELWAAHLTRIVAASAPPVRQLRKVGG
jgi:integrase